MGAITAIPSRRPRLYEVDPTLATKLERHVRAGESFAGAAAACGIGKTTWARWRRHAKRGDPDLVELFDRLDKARERFRQTGSFWSLYEAFDEPDEDDCFDDDDLDYFDRCRRGSRRTTLQRPREGLARR